MIIVSLSKTTIAKMGNYAPNYLCSTQGYNIYSLNTLFCHQRNDNLHLNQLLLQKTVIKHKILFQSQNKFNRPMTVKYLPYYYNCHHQNMSNPT